MNRSAITALLIKHEGIKLQAYQDHLGFWTIGVGRLIDQKRRGGITETEALYLLNNDITACLRDLESIFQFEWDKFPDPVKMAMVSLRFQLGPGGFRGFKKMIGALKFGDFKSAAAQMKDSNWYRQTPRRADELIKMVLQERAQK